ncbi:MAG TPA: TIGR03435 family protein [Candidatus Acidoferrum sp.]|nr:TIGR03435 family protein [Candidatus Acidoferrum sp.]
MKPLYAIAAIFLAAAWAFAQSAPPKLEFEVASIRPTQDARPDSVTAGLKMDGSQAHFGSLSIRNLITMAYKVQPNQITGPDWISSQRFDISAKLPDGSTTDQIPEMLQNLLAGRFALKIHRESKDFPAYALVVGKPPLKLKESAPDTSATDQSNGSVTVAVTGSAAGVSMNLGHGSSATFANNQFQFTRVSMDVMASQLSRYLDRPVVNMTDLKSQYDATFTVTQEDYYILLVRSGANAGVTMPPQAMRLLDAGPPTSLFDAIDQIGLHLDSRKLPLDMIVVDSALQAPTDN